jgi:hypothetical protein
MMRLAVLLLGVTLATSAYSAAPLDPKGVKLFEDKIRPVLVQKCFVCHSVDAQKAKKLRGGLYLDSREGLRKGGDNGPLLDGLLMKALRHDGDIKMPPKAKLPDAVIADFDAWLKMGAPDPRDSSAPVVKTIDIEAGKRYWAFQPLNAKVPDIRNPQLPVRNPIDAFLLAKLQEKGLTLSSPVDREKLIRRLSYGLTGLPPTPEEIDAFVKDAVPDAVEKLVDRLLRSERFGERWARHWLDVVRFAESGGYEFDGFRAGAHHYRDFAIKAFNDDLPFTEFVRLQIAGDHLKPGDFQATSATGFVVAGPYPGQTTVKTQELIRYDHLDDMLSTLGTSMLGLSLGCARCHDHKYDPVPQADYYRLLAAFGRTDSTSAKIDLTPEATRKVREDFDKAHVPLVAARDKFDRESLPGRVQAWLASIKSKPAPAWSVLDLVSATGRQFTKVDDTLLAMGPAAKGAETYTLVFHTQQRGISGLRIEGLKDASLPKMGAGRGINGEFSTPTVTLTAAPLQGKEKPATIKLKTTPKDQTFLVETEGVVGFTSGTVLTLALKFDGPAIGKLRVSLTTARPAKIDAPSAPQAVNELLLLLDEAKGEVSDKTRAAIVRWFRQIDAPTKQVHDAVEQHILKEPKPNLTTVFAAQSGRGGDVYHLIRGEVEKKNGVAKPGFLQVMINGPEQRWLANAGKPDVPPRVALASWITDSEQGAGSLLARVIVNRMWQHHFGKGIVATPNDFGHQGEPPTHPELLDWLAGELIRNGWRLKPIHKLIVTSAAYAQASETTPDGLRVDPQNHLLWRRTPHRLEAEAIRDALLAVSGSLDTTMYGPGSLDGNILRRSVYLTVKRSQMIPLLQIFDAPEAIQSIGERPTTTVPTQALAFMNSPFVRQRAEKFAQRIRKPTEPLDNAIDQAYRLALTRLPTGTERLRMQAFIEKQAESYGKNPKATDQALIDFCQVLLCLNEFVYID